MLKVLLKTALPILELPRFTKRIVAFSIDVSLCILTVWLAFYLRLGEFVPLNGRPILAIVISLLLAPPIFVMSGLYRVIFRYSGWPALLLVARAIAIYGLLYSSLIAAISFDGVPRTVGLIQPLLLLITIGVTRALVGYWPGSMYRSDLRLSASSKTLIYGAGSAGRQLLSALDQSCDIQVVGFLDDDDRLPGQILNGQPIFSPNDLGELIESKSVTLVLLAIPSASRHRRFEILNSIGQFSVAVRTLPGMSDLAKGRVKVSDLQDLDLEDLLSREPIAPNRILMARNTVNKVVLVTGAGGSIGSELCRQIIKLKPTRLLLIDINEFALYSIHDELNKSLQSADGYEQQRVVVSLLASVADDVRMEKIIDTWRPDTVYHAAAYKHVPIVEHNLAEGLKNNVFGTLFVAQISALKGVSNFVLISTDKAVRPTNIMGASKRLAEMCLQALQVSSEKYKSTAYSIVRFGNVLGSSGSVIPKFSQQIRDGGPVTLTDREIIRYFMTIPEAAQLVMQAGSLRAENEVGIDKNEAGVFVLDMGEPVKIYDLACRMVELSGLRVRNEACPEGDIEIKIVGLRPGEKLYEELLIGNTPLATKHPRIMMAHEEFISWADLEPEIKSLKNAIENSNIELIREMVKKIVTDYTPEKKIVDNSYMEQMRNKQFR